MRATTEEVRDRVHIGAILAQAKMAGFRSNARFNALVWNLVVAIFFLLGRTIVSPHNHEADQALEGSNYEMRQMPAHLAQHYF